MGFYNPLSLDLYLEVCQAVRQVWGRTLTEAEQETLAGSRDGNSRSAGPWWLGALRFTSGGLTSALDRLGVLGGAHPEAWRGTCWP